MQADTLVQDRDFQRTLSQSPFSEGDLPRLSSEIGKAYTRLEDEQKKQLQELSDDLSDFSTEELRTFKYFLVYLRQNRARYSEIVSKMYAGGLIEQGSLPEAYSPAFFSFLTSLVDGILVKKKEQETTRGFAKGGIVSLKAAAEKVRKAGRDGDTVLAHITPAEAALLKSRGGAGTINPKTGLPEYKSIFSKIGSFFKKAAPIILPIALNFLVPGLGAIASGAIGAGVGSLIGGAKPGEALKAALLGGLGGAVVGGIGGTLSGSGFMAGVQGALPSGFGGATAAGPGFFEGIGEKLGFGAATGTPPVPPASIPDNLGVGFETVSGSVSQMPSAAAIADAAKSSTGSTSSLGIGSLVDKATGLIKEYPKTAVALGLGAGALLAGAGKGDKAPPPLVKGPSSRELMEQNPSRYTFDIANFRPRYTTGAGLFSAATGGLAKKGGKVSGPGTETSDSIPARLSDGEFVFTAKAVRGAGGGDRMKGARKMYELMHKFERMA
jgi:hypothetical protein